MAVCDSDLWFRAIFISLTNVDKAKKKNFF